MIKKLYLFVLKSFLPLFAMTFCIVLFIVLMQFLWRYIDDLVGKGLELKVLAELFGYAAVTMVPTALPLAILLASLMTFGNLGEKFELTAMKASGVSLMRVMRPLIVFIGFIAVGAFFFQDYVLPKAQVKMWTLLFSMRQKSPELEIPENVFYDQIPGYNLYVGHKNRENGMLYDVMIYDVSRGGENATVMRADSARLAFTKGLDHLYLHMWQGEQFENLADQSTTSRNTPFRRESFLEKEIMIPFDANFNRLDDNAMRKQYVGKNMQELSASIDSIGLRLDSIGRGYEGVVLSNNFAGVSSMIDPKTRRVMPYKPVQMPAKLPDIDSLLRGSTPMFQKQVVQVALAQARSKQQEYEFKAMSMADDRKILRRHQIEMMKKFTLSVACVVFFFIGAPLGAIIRKGGLGTPLVISVLLFCFYYIIDNTGYKMARDGHWIVWQGMWLSTAVLAPLGAYVTYKAMNDSAVFNPDAWRIAMQKLAGKLKMRVVIRWMRVKWHRLCHRMLRKWLGK